MVDSIPWAFAVAAVGANPVSSAVQTTVQSSFGVHPTAAAEFAPAESPESAHAAAEPLANRKKWT